MKHLFLETVRGDLEDVRRLAMIFKGVSIAAGCSTDQSQVVLTIVKKLPNFYAHQRATVDEHPLFILVPNMLITAVWPAPHSDSRMYYGTATRVANGQIIPVTPGIAIHDGKTCAGMYICLSPGINSDHLEDGYLGI